jgi:hypothetical protein
MSWCLCHNCGCGINSDDDPDCFVNIKAMWTAAICFSCREEMNDEQLRCETETANESG